MAVVICDGINQRVQSRSGIAHRLNDDPTVFLSNIYGLIYLKVSGFEHIGGQPDGRAVSPSSNRTLHYCLHVSTKKIQG